MKRRVWRRRLLVLSGVAVGLLILIWQIVPMAAAPYVRAKLQAMIAEQLNAELTMGRLAYHFPYGVSVSDARLIATDPQGAPVNLLTADRIDLKLAQHPFHSGPLVIERLEIDAPAARIVKTSQGLVGRGLTVKDAQPESVRREKLSEMFELRKVRLSGGSIVYEDRVSPSAVPLVWRDLVVDLSTQPQSGGEYAYQLTAGDGKVASLSSEGSLNIDTLLLRLTKCSIRAAVDPKATDSPVPGELQQLLREFAVAGEVVVNCGGDVPLAEPSKAKATTTLELAKVTATLRAAEAPLDEVSLKLTCAVTPEHRLTRVTIDQLLARGGDVVVRGDGGELALNMTSSAVGVNGLKLACDTGTDRKCLPKDLRATLDHFKLSGGVTCALDGSAPLGNPRAMLNGAQAELRVSLRDLRLQPTELPDAVHDVEDMTVRLANNSLTAQAIRARYGNDIVFIREARLPLKELPTVLNVEQLAGAVTFDYPHAKYPPDVAKFLEQVRPKGPFFFDGSARLDFAKAKPLETYQVRVSSERAALSTMWHHVPLTNVVTDLLVTPTYVDITKFNADVLTGKVATSGRIDLAGDIPTYAGRVRLRRVDLNRLAEFLVEPGEPPIAVTGEFSSDFAVSGKGIDPDQALDALQAEGALEVANGDLFHVPVLEDVAERVRLGSAGRVGEAAAVFKVANRRIQLTNAAVGAPAVGVRWSGNIAFDGSLDLELIATQFNDWEKHIRRDDNAVANVAGAIAGTVQKGLNAVTKELLYRMKVSGTVEKPEIHVIAAPVLQR